MALIETITGLTLLYGLLAVVTSAAKELIEAWVQKRKKDLKGAVAEKVRSEADAQKYCGIGAGQSHGPAELVACVQKVSPTMLGWIEERRDKLVESPVDWILVVMGHFLTAIAISLGVPFWFDLLNSVSNVRSTFNPKT